MCETGSWFLPSWAPHLLDVCVCVTSRQDYPARHSRPVSGTDAAWFPQEAGQRVARQGAMLTSEKRGKKSTPNNLNSRVY